MGLAVPLRGRAAVRNGRLRSPLLGCAGPFVVFRVSVGGAPSAVRAQCNDLGQLSTLRWIFG